MVDNIQLLYRSAEDVKSDTRQWAASSGKGDITTDGIEQNVTEKNNIPRTGYRPDSINIAIYLLDILRNTITGNKVTAGLQDNCTSLKQMY